MIDVIFLLCMMNDFFKNFATYAIDAAFDHIRTRLSVKSGVKPRKLVSSLFNFRYLVKALSYDLKKNNIHVYKKCKKARLFMPHLFNVNIINLRKKKIGDYFQQQVC